MSYRDDIRICSRLGCDMTRVPGSEYCLDHAAGTKPPEPKRALKVGDKVRCIDPLRGALRAGEVYVVSHAWKDGHHYFVDVFPSSYTGGLVSACKRERFALESAPEPKRALRFNKGKAQLFYLDMFPDATREVVRTLMYGTQREREPYPQFNWCDGAPYTELYDCARRHMQDWLNGAEIDRDADQDKWQVHNLAFAIGNLLRLLQQIQDGRTDLDDRGYRQGKGPAKDAK